MLGNQTFFSRHSKVIQRLIDRSMHSSRFFVFEYHIFSSIIFFIPEVLTGVSLYFSTMALFIVCIVLAESYTKGMVMQDISLLNVKFNCHLLF